MLHYLKGKKPRHTLKVKMGVESFSLLATSFADVLMFSIYDTRLLSTMMLILLEMNDMDTW